MKKYLLLLVALSIPASLFSQQSVWDKDENGSRRTNWDGSTKVFTYIDTTSANGDSLESKIFELARLSRNETNFEGLLSVYLQVDSVAAATTGKTAGELDSLIFFPEYWLGDLGWVIGDTITWSQIPTLADATPATTQNMIITGTDHGKQWMWRTNGTSTGIQGYAYDIFRLKMKCIGDSTWVQIKSSIAKY